MSVYAVLPGLKQDVGIVADDVMFKVDPDAEGNLHLISELHISSTLESKNIHTLAGRLLTNHLHAVALQHTQGEWEVSTRLPDVGRPSTHDPRDVACSGVITTYRVSEGSL